MRVIEALCFLSDRPSNFFLGLFLHLVSYIKRLYNFCFKLHDLVDMCGCVYIHMSKLSER